MSGGKRQCGAGACAGNHVGGSFSGTRLRTSPLVSTPFHSHNTKFGQSLESLTYHPHMLWGGQDINTGTRQA